MVGNVHEWVAEWVPRSTACGAWSAGLSATGDLQCLGGAAVAGEPGALLRGGSFGNGTGAGPLMISGFEAPVAFNSVGFRCAR
jgi:formylglycine-generating enzyme required for sulfatase activity